MFQGYNDDAGNDIRNQRLWWVEEQITSHHVGGEHLFPTLSNSRFDWKLAFSRADREEPDLREVLYESDPARQAFVLADESQSGLRQFNDLADDTIEANVNWSSLFEQWSGFASQVKFGGSFIDRSRDFQSRRLRFVPRNLIGGEVSGARDLSHRLGSSASRGTRHRPLASGAGAVHLGQHRRRVRAEGGDPRHGPLRRGAGGRLILRNDRPSALGFDPPGDRCADRAVPAGRRDSRSVRGDHRPADGRRAAGLARRDRHLPGHQPRLRRAARSERPAGLQPDGEPAGVPGGLAVRVHRRGGRPGHRRQPQSQPVADPERRPALGVVPGCRGGAVGQLLLQAVRRPDRAHRRADRAAPDLVHQRRRPRRTSGSSSRPARSSGPTCSWARTTPTSTPRSRCRRPRARCRPPSRDRSPARRRTCSTRCSRCVAWATPAGFSSTTSTTGSATSARSGLPDIIEKARHSVDFIFAKRFDRASLRIALTNLTDQAYEFTQGGHGSDAADLQPGALDELRRHLSPVGRARPRGRDVRAKEQSSQPRGARSVMNGNHRTAEELSAMTGNAMRRLARRALAAGCAGRGRGVGRPRPSPRRRTSPATESERPAALHRQRPVDERRHVHGGLALAARRRRLRRRAGPPDHRGRHADLRALGDQRHPHHLAGAPRSWRTGRPRRRSS